MINIDKNVVGIDIETTSLTPVGKGDRKNYIWSAAIQRGNEKEATPFFLENDLLEKGTFFDYIREGKSLFQQEQLDQLAQGKGPYAELVAAKEQGKLISQKQLLGKFLESLSGGGMVLIQNINFENRWLSPAAKEEGMFGDISKRFRYIALSKEGEPKTFLHKPPVITNMSLEAQGAFKELFNDFRKTRKLDDTKLKSYAEQHQAIIGQYNKEFEEAITADLRIGADLQDFTRALYATAAYTNPKIFRPEALRANATNINLLAQVFLETKEKHIAKTDLEQEFEIIKEISPIYDQLTSGKLAPESERKLKLLDIGLRASGPNALWSSAESQISTFITSGELRLSSMFERDIDPINVHDTLKDEIIRTNVQGKEGETLRFNESTASRDIKRIFGFIGENILQRYGEIPEIKELLEQPVDDIDNLLENLKLRKKQSEIALAGIITDTNIALKAGKASEFTSSEIISEAERIQEHVIPTKKLKLNKATAAIAAFGAVGAGLIYLAGKDPEKEEQQQQQIKRKKKQPQTPNAIFESFNYKRATQQIYSGSGFYNWENRTRHHEA